MYEYAIRFEYEDGSVAYAAFVDGACGWAPTLATAARYETKGEAERFLANGYGKTSEYGQVVTLLKDN